MLAPCALLALFIHPSTSHHLVDRIFWAFCVYLEAVSVLPQLRVMQNTKDGFYDYLRGTDCSDVEVYAISEGFVFPKVPLMRVEGPSAVVQLLETPFVNLINYASLVATNAARHRFVGGKSKMLLEFGLRRVQGPDGGIGASKYCYIGTQPMFI